MTWMWINLIVWEHLGQPWFNNGGHLHLLTYSELKKITGIWNKMKNSHTFVWEFIGMAALLPLNKQHLKGDYISAWSHDSEHNLRTQVRRLWPVGGALQAWPSELLEFCFVGGAEVLKLAEGGGQRQPGQSLQGGDAWGQPLNHKQEVLDKGIDLLQGEFVLLLCESYPTQQFKYHS